MNLNYETLELSWLKFLQRNRNNPDRWNTHDCPNAVVVVAGDVAVKFSGSVSRLVIGSATLIVLALTFLLSLFIYMVVDFYCVVGFTIIIMFKMVLNALGLAGEQLRIEKTQPSCTSLETTGAGHTDGNEDHEDEDFHEDDDDDDGSLVDNSELTSEN